MGRQKLTRGVSLPPTTLTPNPPDFFEISIRLSRPTRTGQDLGSRSSLDPRREDAMTGDTGKGMEGKGKKASDSEPRSALIVRSSLAPLPPPLLLRLSLCLTTQIELTLSDDG